MVGDGGDNGGGQAACAAYLRWYVFDLLLLLIFCRSFGCWLFSGPLSSNSSSSARFGSNHCGPFWLSRMYGLVLRGHGRRYPASIPYQALDHVGNQTLIYDYDDAQILG